MNRAWMDSALCAQIGGDLFFPDRGNGYHAAIEICARCPVRDHCAQAAAQFEGDKSRHLRHGAWGGHTPKTRSQNQEAA